ncbi:hypothetical protein PsorP6_011955 [Peronosclerospora sorghi]|uniref:Uncharacterized protein n=1 Tax=Peronosclerospora sorghi TaxID=230839 RepID=A0ACC0WK30_9STRA|nr:hypothetical protein PsorP6_011955 [Peronosclerospora sorghi]
MEWQDEKKALLATISRQEQEMGALARRFRLLQATLKEQQKLLERYQRALGVVKGAKVPEAAKSSGSAKTESKPTELVDHTWIKKRADLNTSFKPKEKTAPFKPGSKRKRNELAATWAEEKQKIGKKPAQKHIVNVSASETSNKENVQTLNRAQSFAYVEVVRNRDERKALPGHDCVQCKKYYNALDENGAADAAAQKGKCSRHRARLEPYETPDDFWRLSFPDSEPQ